MIDTPEQQHEQSMPQSPHPHTQLLVRGWRRIVYYCLGWLMLSLGIIGAFLPLLPTVPFVLAAGYFFVRSSPRMNHRLMKSPFFGPMLKDWQKYRGVRLRTKLLAVTMIVGVIGSSLLFGKLSLPLRIMLIVLGSIGLFTVLRLKTVRH